MKLLRMRLENFMCHEKLELKLDGKSANIFGFNGTGKSTIKHAFRWVFEGKNADGTASLNPRPTDKDGEQIHKIVVLAELDFDNFTISRTLKEDWTRATADEPSKLKGQTSTYEVDGVEIKSTKLAERLAEIGVDIEALKYIYDSRLFLGDLDWKTRRGVLSEIAKLPSIEEIVAKNPALKAIDSRVISGRISVEEYQATLRKSKKAAEDKSKEINAILEESASKAAECTDAVEDVKKRLALLQEQKKELKSKAVIKPASEVMEAQKALEEELKKVNAENNAINKAILDFDAKLSFLNKKVDNEKATIYRADMRINSLRDNHTILEKEVADAKAEWKALKSAKPGLCPTCGQEMPEKLALENIKKALQEVEERGKKYSAYIADNDKKTKGEESLKTAAEQAIIEIGKQIKVLGARPEQTVKTSEKISGLRAIIDNAKPGEVPPEILAAITEIDAKIETESGLLVKAQINEDNLKRAEELERQLKGLTATITAAMGEENLLSLLQSKKAELIEGPVNALVPGLKFRMFETALNGNVKEACLPLIDGIPYSETLNKAARHNAGLKMIKVLQKHYNLVAPVIIDDAEGVIELEPMPETQIIRLVVSEQDKNIRMEVLS